MSEFWQEIETTIDEQGELIKKIKEEAPKLKGYFLKKQFGKFLLNAFSVTDNIKRSKEAFFEIRRRLYLSLSTMPKYRDGIRGILRKVSKIVKDQEETEETLNIWMSMTAVFLVLTGRAKKF